MHCKTPSFAGTTSDTRAQMPDPSCTHAPQRPLRSRALGRLCSRSHSVILYSEVVVAHGATQLHRGRSRLFPCNCLPLFSIHHHHPFIRAGRIYHRQDPRITGLGLQHSRREQRGLPASTAPLAAGLRRLRICPFSNDCAHFAISCRWCCNAIHDHTQLLHPSVLRGRLDASEQG